jgi:hypothetical protein
VDPVPEENNNPALQPITPNIERELPPKLRLELKRKVFVFAFRENIRFSQQKDCENN